MRVVVFYIVCIVVQFFVDVDVFRIIVVFVFIIVVVVILSL